MAPADPGLQPERTSLAWRRTALSVLVGSLGVAKILPPGWQDVAWLCGIAGLAWAADLFLVARHSYAEGRAAVVVAGERYAGAAIARTSLAGATVGGFSLVLVVSMGSWR